MFSTHCCCSVTKSCLILCNPMDCSMPGLSIHHHHLPEFKFIKLVTLSNHLIFCHSLLLLPSIFPSIRVFSNESALRMRLAQLGMHFSLTSWEDYRSIFAIFSKMFVKSQNWSYVILAKWKLIIKEKLSLNLVKQNYFILNFIPKDLCNFRLYISIIWSDHSNWCNYLIIYQYFIFN